MATPIWTQGTLLYFEDGTTPDTFHLLSGVRSLNPSSATVETIDTTTLEKTAREFIGGLVDYGSMTFQLDYDPNDTQHTRLRDKLGTSTPFKMAVGFPQAATAQYIEVSGILESFNISAGANDTVKADVSIKLSGTPTYSGTAPTAAT